MKILHLVASPTLTGPADPALALAKIERALLGYDSRIAFDRARPGNMAEKCEAAGVPALEGLVLSTKRGLLDAIRDRRVLRRLAKEYDVIHAHSSHDHALAVLSKLRAKIVRTIHHPRSTARRAVQGFAYARTDAFVLVARAHAAALAKNYSDLDPERLFVVPGSVDCARFHPSVEGRAFRRSIGVDEDAFAVAMISRIKPGRRHEVLVRAFAKMMDKVLSARLVLIGKGEGMPSILQLIQSTGIGERAVFAGFRDADLPQAIVSADVTVLLSEGNDANCRAVLESLACGVPVIGGRHAAIVDALESGGCGALIDPDDTDALAAALELHALAPRDQRESWRRSARARAEERYSERRLADDIRRVYEAIAFRAS